MSSFNVPAVKAGLSSAVSPESGLVDRAQSGGNVPATTFSTMHAQRVGDHASVMGVILPDLGKLAR